MPLVYLKKYNSYTNDFCCKLVKKTRESASNFYGFLTKKFSGRCEFACTYNNHMRARVCMCVLRQFLQPVQYCASFNRGVMPVLPVNTVPNIGILLAYYWHSTDAVFYGSNGETLT